MTLNEKGIVSYLHCALCIDEWSKSDDAMSPSDYQNHMVEVGWTKEGLQVWCKRHDCNIIHVDFEGMRHRADTTRKKE